MTLPLPVLDDLTYEELVRAAIARIPIECPEWTDHNPSDTGIILIELLAWLTEMTLYRVDQIPDENYDRFLRLLDGEKYQQYQEYKKSSDYLSRSNSDKHDRLLDRLEKTLANLRDPYRAVTAEDYEYLVLEKWNQEKESENNPIARVKCFPLLDIETNQYAEGLVSLLVVPKSFPPVGDNPQPSPTKYTQLENFLNKRRLLGTRVKIVEAKPIPIAIKATLILSKGANVVNVKNNADRELTRFFSPIESEPYWQGKGWPFGQGVYRSKLYQILDDLEGIDYVENLCIDDKETDLSLEKCQLPQFPNSSKEDPNPNADFTLRVRAGNGYRTL